MSELENEIRQVLENAGRFLQQQRDLFGEILYAGGSEQKAEENAHIVKAKSQLHQPEEIDLFGAPAPSGIPILKSPIHAQQQYPGEPWVTATTVDDLNSRICTCLKCPLGKTRTNFVFGVGNPHADVVVVGEAPGADEDAQGEPFVGRAGQLLNKILDAIQFKREEVFICNILKCRPPNNRDPLPEEIDLCEPYLWKQLEIIKPKMILCLGRIAGQSLLKTNDTLTSLRGKFFDYRGISLMVTYHPAALLRNPNWKKPAWEDVQLFRKKYDEMKSTSH
ncbi:MAG TPA: uracil-DNA glycosylase [Bacteroidota bacterium]